MQIDHLNTEDMVGKSHLSRLRHEFITDFYGTDHIKSIQTLLSRLL